MSVSALLNSLLELTHESPGNVRWHDEPDDYAALAGLSLDARDGIPTRELNIALSGIDRNASNERCRNGNRFRQSGFILFDEDRPHFAAIRSQRQPQFPGDQTLTFLHENVKGPSRKIRRNFNDFSIPAALPEAGREPGHTSSPDARMDPNPCARLSNPGRAA